MHRSNFRLIPHDVKTGARPPLSNRPPESPPLDKSDLADVRGQLDTLVGKIDSALRAFQKSDDDVALPADLAKSVLLLHGRLERLEMQQKQAEKGQKDTQSTFAGVLRDIMGRLDRLTDGDSKFSLAHELEALNQTLGKPVRLKRDAHGDINGWEVGEA